MSDQKTTSRKALEGELIIRRRQVGLLANCLSHIQASQIAPEGIKIAATTALVGAAEIANDLPGRKAQS